MKNLLNKKDTSNELYTLSNELYTLLPSVLDHIIEYIEDTEVFVDGEWGSCRNLKELIRDKEMPELYDKLIALRNGR